MRRAALALVSTVTALVLLLSFKTHAVGTTNASSTATHRADTSGTSTGAAAAPTAAASAATATASAATASTAGGTFTGQEAEQAGSANIDMVSGATYTSDGYLQSLQSALDQAGL